MIEPSPGESPDGPRRNLPYPLIGALAGAVIIGIVVVLVVFGGGGNGDGDNGTNGSQAGVDEHAGLATAEPTPEATIDLNRPTVEANSNLTSLGADDKLVIAKYGVSAPLTYRSVGIDGVMPNPEGPDDVAYYDFSAWPGKGGAPGRGGNGVFAGHVDSGSKACKNGTVAPPCQAVFWDISNLRVGDEIEVHLSGAVHKYKVTSNQPISAANGPWDQIVSATAQESITLITCGGDFNRETREYSNRQVVVAVRV
jgi:LPXTG-site transpeptidase (sortase) family protein